MYYYNRYDPLFPNSTIKEDKFCVTLINTYTRVWNDLRMFSTKLLFTQEFYFWIINFQIQPAKSRRAYKKLFSLKYGLIDDNGFLKDFLFTQNYLLYIKNEAIIFDCMEFSIIYILFS